MKKTFTTLFSVTFAVCSFVKTANAQWQAVNNGLGSNNVNAVATSGTNVLAATDAGLFLSGNDGANWAAVTNTNLATGDIKALATSGTDLFAATYGKGVFLSTDNGVTWNPVNSGFSFLYACSVATIGTKIFASMSFDGVYYSTNSGTNWTKVTTSPLKDITVNAMIASGPNLIAASGSCNGSSTGGVFLSTDNGTTWTATSITGDATALTIIGTTVFAATQNGVFKSLDNGATWLPTANASGVIDNALSFQVLGTQLIVGVPAGIYSSTNDGSSWSNISGSTGILNLSVTSFATNNTNLFVGNIYHSVGVYKRPLSDFGITSVKESNKNFSFSIYPNPSKGKFKVDISSLKDEQATMEVFNLLGEKIQSFTDLKLQSANEIDLSNSAKGIYFVKISTEAKSHTQKIIVE